MDKHIVDRVLDEAKYVIDTNSTIRIVADIYKVSKSTVHKDLQERLLEIDPILHKKISEIFSKHIDIRHINGGESTRKKYAKM